MNTFLKKKTVGFYLTVLATILTVIGLIFYLSYRSVQVGAIQLTVAAICVEVLLIVVSAVAGNKPILDLASSISAILLAAGVMVSLPSQIDGFGFLAAGLYTFDDIRNGVIYLVLAVVALLFYIVASFMNLGKE